MAASLAAVVFAAAAGEAFAADGTGTSHRTIGTNWIDERAATTGQTGSWSEGVAYDPDTQTADIDGEAVFMPNAASAGNYVTLKFTMTLDKVAEDKSPEADAQAGLRVGTNGCFQVWTKGDVAGTSRATMWLDATASGIVPATGKEYYISFVLDYTVGKYSVLIMDAKGVWQLLKSAAGMHEFPIAEKAKKIKDVILDGEGQFRSLKGSFTSFGANHDAWRFRRCTEAPIMERGGFVAVRRDRARKLEVSSLYGVTNHGAWRFRHRTEAPRAEIGGFVAVRRLRARKLEVS